MPTPIYARELWCPFARYDNGYNDGASNRWRQSLPRDEPHALNPIPCRCIAQECMAWRWVRPPTPSFTVAPDPSAKDEPPRPEGVPASWFWDASDPDNPAGWCQPEEEAEEHTAGYCGLAGSPLPFRGPNT